MSSDGAEAGEPTGVRPALAGIAVLLLLGAAALPLPGIDQPAALHELGRWSGWWAREVGAWPPAFSLLSGGLLGLVVARLSLDLLVTPSQPPAAARLWAAAVLGLYLGGSGLSGVMFGLTLAERFPDLLTGDGRLVALVAGACGLATAALLWSLADLVRRSGLASGALLLFLVWELLRGLRYAVELIGAIWVGESELGMLALHTGAMPIALTFLALWRWTPSTWPRPVVRGLFVRGPLDLLALPLVAGAIAGTLASDLAGYPVWTPQPPIYDPGLIARTVAALLAVPAIALWLRRQPGSPGGPAWLVAAAALGLLTVAIALLAIYGTGGPGYLPASSLWP